MKINLKILLLLLFFIFSCKEKIAHKNDFVIYQTNPKKENIKFYWKNDSGEILKSIDNLKTYLKTKNKKLTFAMNAGMFEADNFPKGLYIENFKTLKILDTLKTGNGNFYLQPNGVFFISKNNEAKIVETKNFNQKLEAKYATQSGPMLVVQGKINPIFQKDSKNLNIRNGVGILENGEIVFAMSKKEVNFYDFALLFKQLGCKNALYLDGFVSRTYLPEKNWIQKDGNFGVMIGVSDILK